MRHERLETLLELDDRVAALVGSTVLVVCLVSSTESVYRTAHHTTPHRTGFMRRLPPEA